MKVHDFAYQVAMHAIKLLEETQHYKVPEPVRKQIGEQVLRDVDDLMKKAK